jgi:glycerol kinase
VNVLAIDQGTSGTKALVVAPDGRVLGSGQVDVRPTYGDGGAVEVEPQALLHSVVEAGRAAIRAAAEPVAAVGLANQGETVLAWERGTGRPLTPAIVWQDRRAAGVCERLAPATDRLAELTGLALDPYFAAPKMTWLRENRTRDGVVTTSDAWLVHALTGEFVTDASTASRTLLLDLDRVAWSAEALEQFGLAGEELPRVADCAEVVGETPAFGDAVPLAGLVVDQQAALYAQRCLEAGSAKCTYGTGAFLLANAGARPRRSRSGLTASVAWRAGGATAYCLDGQVYTAASAVRWLADLGLIRDGRDLDAVGGTVADAGGVTFVPALAGLAAPYWRSDARGALHGLGLETTRGHLVRALVDGIACQVVELARATAADLGGSLDALRVDGGLTRSRLLMQTQADLLQLPVEVHPTPDATALGAGALARLALDPALGLTGALGPAEAPAAVFEPAIGADEAAARLDRYAALAARL